MIANKLHKIAATRALYLINFLLGAHIALVVYFNSNFLESRGISEDYLGILYALGSIISIIVLALLPKILKRFGNYRTLLTSTVLEIILFIGIALCPYVWALMLMFAMSIATSVPLFFGLDIFLKNFNDSKTSNTADVRSTFLTTLNMAFVASPFFAGQLLGDNNNYTLVYLISASLLVPVLYLVRKEFKKFKDPKYNTVSIKPILKAIENDVDLRNIFIVQFIIRFFFSWMVIYIPIYLTQHLGFSLAQLGVMFSIMLLPFVLLEYPLGHYVDKRFGEKEFLIIGFTIIALATASISFITSSDFMLWTTILVLTRIGAAMVEVMNEIYFFKHVHGDDLDTIGAFRVLRPLAYIIGPALGTIFIVLIGIQTLFIILGFISLIGLFASSRIKDTI